MNLEPLVNTVLRKKREAPSGLSLPPRLGGGLPVVGHTVDFVRDTIGLLTRAQREVGEVAAFDVLGRKMVAIFGPNAHEAVFRAPDEQLNPSEAYKIMTPVFGKGMVYDAPPEKMNEQMKMLLPALKDRRMRTYGEIVVREVEQSIANWGESGEFDLVDYCRVLTNYTSSHCLLGHEFRTGMTEEFSRVYASLERGITPVAYLNAHLPLPSFRERDRARIRLEEMVTRLIQERRKSGREGEDFLQTLMDARYKSGVPLTEYEITGMLIASMFAGHHTSSVTTAWALIELVNHPDYLERVRGELDAAFGGGEEVGYFSLRNALLTEYTVLETLRLHPPLFMLVRVVMKDFVYGRYFFEKGTWVLISPTVSHRMPEYFREPDRFDPDRFAPPREEDKRDFAYIPFGGGRHKCMGNAFAILQVKAILSILLRRYDFELVNPNVESDFHGLVVGPKEPARVRYRRRAANVARTYSAPTTTTAETPSAKPSTSSTKAFSVALDLDLCQGHGMCEGEAPEVFRAIGVGKSRVLAPRPDVALRSKVEAAAKYCPTQAIRIVEDS
ncbi:MAG: cytochrome P450 [Polyangiaceae bacterium]